MASVWTTVQNSRINSWRYHSKSRIFDLRFEDGSEFRYFNVHPDVASKFRRADKEKFLERAIRPFYRLRRVWPPELSSDDSFDSEVHPMTHKDRAEWRERRAREAMQTPDFALPSSR